MSDVIEDLVDGLAGIAPGMPLDTLRRERLDIRGHIEGAYRALLLPGPHAGPGGIAPAERAGLAATAAELDGGGPLSVHFERLGVPEPGPRWALLRNHVAAVVLRPDQVGQVGLDGLADAGLTPQDVVALTQLAAFVPFQMRLLAGLRAMAGAAGRRTPAPVPAVARFTAAEVAWTPRLPPVDEATATPAQLAALDACPPAVRGSAYFRTLAHDPASLAERGALFNAVMYAPHGLKRAERELAAAVVSMVNGCVYCCSVHARRFTELTREPDTMGRLLTGGFTTTLDPRYRAIVDFSAKLTATPSALGSPDLVALAAAGIVGLPLLDLVHAVAMFANANRLMLALGESTPPG